jgi:hypothetical protein
VTPVVTSRHRLLSRIHRPKYLPHGRWAAFSSGVEVLWSDPYNRQLTCAQYAGGLLVRVLRVPPTSSRHDETGGPGGNRTRDRFLTKEALFH